MELAALEQAVSADPNNPEARLALGEALLASGNADGALDHLRKALGLRRDYLGAYLALGRALLAEGEQIAAIATLEGGREIARKLGKEEWGPRFDEALDGLGPVKRRGAGPIDENAFHDIAAKTIGVLSRALQAIPEDITIQQTPGVLVFEVRRKAKMGVSEQRTHRELWCTSALGEFKFRFVASSKCWRTADGDELAAVVGRFLTLQIGDRVTVELNLQ